MINQKSEVLKKTSKDKPSIGSFFKGLTFPKVGFPIEIGHPFLRPR